MSTQAPPLPLQRCQRRVTVIGPVPAKAASVAFKSAPTAAVPPSAVELVCCAGIACTTPVAAEATESDAPPGSPSFEPVTTTLTVCATSAGASSSDAPVAPPMSLQPPPPALQRCHRRVIVIEGVPEN